MEKKIAGQNADRYATIECIERRSGNVPNTGSTFKECGCKTDNACGELKAAVPTSIQIQYPRFARL